MASRGLQEMAHTGDILLVIHDFVARSEDELNLTRGDRIELLERDDEFGDGWFLGRHLQTAKEGLFPEVYTTLAPKPTLAPATSKPLANASTALPNAPLTQSENYFQASSPAAETRPAASMPDAANAYVSPVDDSLNTTRLSAARSEPQLNVLSASANHGQPSSHLGQRSASGDLRLSNPVLNETLSVIDEHITDMNTPRHGLHPTTSLRTDDEYSSEYGGPMSRRLSTINGDETDEEEAALPYTEAEVLQWDADRVADMLRERGADDHQCQVFRDEEISGEVLMHMDQSALMLKQFDLGKMGKRLALWHKINDFQMQVRGQGPISTSRHGQSGSISSAQDRPRSKSGTAGTVLPRIPSLMDSPRTSMYGQQQNQARRSISQSLQPDAIFGAQSVRSDTPPESYSPRPSAASVRELGHNRRHSSIDNTNAGQPRTPVGPPAQPAPAQPHHVKHSSFDRGWTMQSGTPATEQTTPLMDQTPQQDDEHKLSSTEPTELGMTVVSSLDIERGYFSGNEVENRRARNVLRKKDETHARAPSDSFGNKRLSYVFRQKRVGSTDSIQGSGEDEGATQSFYSMPYNASHRAISSPQVGNIQKPANLTAPTVTKLDYSGQMSIDAVAASPPVPNERTSTASSLQNRFTRARATGLRAISDAITGDERAHLIAQETPPQMPTPSRDGSSTPSITSRSIEVDDTSLLKTGTDSTGKTTPVMPMAPRRKGKKETSAYTRGLEKKTPKEQMIGCDYSGWMKKKSSNLMTTWKTRLFVLRGRRLSYYYSEDDTEEKGLIDISFHRVLPANNDRITGLHATVTGAASSPISPQNSSIETTAATDAAKVAVFEKRKSGESTPSGMFIFKLVPPRAGLSKAVNFTKPTVHYFAVDNVQQGRLWMAALMKATIDRDEAREVITTYNQKTISLAKAKAMCQRPPFLAGDDEIADEESIADNSTVDGTVHGLNISFPEDDSVDQGSFVERSMANGSALNGEARGVVTPNLDTNKTLPLPPVDDSRSS